MTALHLISTYSSDSENDEAMGESTVHNETATRLPLPESIATRKSATVFEKDIDDPSAHEGRVRSFKHERGNWSTLVYLDYDPSQAMMEWMVSALKKTPVKFHEEH